MPSAKTTIRAPFTNSSMRPTFRFPNRPGPNTSQYSSVEAASAPNTPARMNADTTRLGDGCDPEHQPDRQNQPPARRPSARRLRDHFNSILFCVFISFDLLVYLQ